MKTKITELLGIEYPIFQGGMAWVAEYHLAAARSRLAHLALSVRAARRRLLCGNRCRRRKN